MGISCTSHLIHWCFSCIVIIIIIFYWYSPHLYTHTSALPTIVSLLLLRSSCPPSLHSCILLLLGINKRCSNTNMTSDEFCEFYDSYVTWPTKFYKCKQHFTILSSCIWIRFFSFNKKTHWSKSVSSHATHKLCVDSSVFVWILRKLSSISLP